jgi:ABC-type methionine transport system permease subunit
MLSVIAILIVLVCGIQLLGDRYVQRLRAR